MINAERAQRAPAVTTALLSVHQGSQLAQPDAEPEQCLCGQVSSAILTRSWRRRMAPYQGQLFASANVFTVRRTISPHIIADSAELALSEGYQMLETCADAVQKLGS